MNRYTAVFTHILGTQQETWEVPCPNVETFAKTTDFFNDHCHTTPFQIVVSIGPYADISAAKRKGEYVFATLHRSQP